MLRFTIILYSLITRKRNLRVALPESPLDSSESLSASKGKTHIVLST